MGQPGMVANQRLQSPHEQKRDQRGSCHRERGAEQKREWERAACQRPGSCFRNLPPYLEERGRWRGALLSQVRLRLSWPDADHAWSMHDKWENPEVLAGPGDRGEDRDVRQRRQPDGSTRYGGTDTKIRCRHWVGWIFATPLPKPISNNHRSCAYTLSSPSLG